MKKTAVVLFNLGGPDSLDSVQPFLENLFNDPDIFKLPFQKQFAELISKRRAPKIVEEYKLIGGKSPIGYWTELQRSLLESRLRQINSQLDVFTAMRYWKPLTKETAQLVADRGYEKIILLPLYPHYSISTTGSSYNEWKRCFKQNVPTAFIRSYQANEFYIGALNAKIDEGLKLFSEEIRSDVQLVFSAHGTPQSYVKKGDPYSFQIQQTIYEIMQLRGNTHEHSICFQSKVGPLKWLEPSTSETIKSLAARGKKNLLIIPVSFVSDHVETLYELNIEYRKIAEQCGITNYFVMPGLNDSPKFIDALYSLVKNQVE
jgi:ferrochelatase